MNNKLYITRREILDAYKHNNLDDLFTHKVKLLEDIEKAKEAKRSLLEMLKNPSKIDMLLKMLQEKEK